MMNAISKLLAAAGAAVLLASPLAASAHGFHHWRGWGPGPYVHGWPGPAIWGGPVFYGGPVVYGGPPLEAPYYAPPPPVVYERPYYHRAVYYHHAPVHRVAVHHVVRHRAIACVPHHA